MDVVTKLSQCLSPTSTIPADVRFLFNEEEKSVKIEIKAHKFVLALASDVFGREFYGSMKEGQDDVDIVDASPEVFQAMIDFVYNKQPDLNKYDLRFLSLLYYLGDKYNIVDLRDKIIVTISSKQEITNENVIEVALLAEENSVHEKLSETLYDVVACFLVKKFGGKLINAINMFSQTEATEAHGLVLMKTMAKMAKFILCSNCQSSTCRNGVGVTRENFMPGAKVTGVNQRGNEQIDRLIDIHAYSDQFAGIMKNGIPSTPFTLDPTYYVYNCNCDDKQT